MPRPIYTREFNAFRLLILVVLLGFLSLPVEYRAGADAPHPHAAFQLWLDVAQRATAHYHGDDATAPSVSKRAPESAIAPIPNITGANFDAPRLTEATLSADRFSLLVSVVLIATLVSACWRANPWPVAYAPVDTRIQPETPPPRRRLVLC